MRIAVVGPESSGKTTLCEALAAQGGARMVPEMAREFLEHLGRRYVEADLLHIAEAQIEREDELAMGYDGVLVCDTDLITIRIWSEEKFGRCDPWVTQQSEQRFYDLWLLCKADIPWAFDPLRENPHDRDRLFDVYKSLLDRLGKPYVIMQGGRDHRLVEATKAIAALRYADGR